MPASYFTGNVIRHVVEQRKHRIKKKNSACVYRVSFSSDVSLLVWDLERYKRNNVIVLVTPLPPVNFMKITLSAVNFMKITLSTVHFMKITIPNCKFYEDQPPKL